MELAALVETISGFHDWSHTDKLKFFAWFLHTYQGKVHFQPREITNCFDSLNLARPNSPHRLLAALAEKKPPELLLKSQGYLLEGRVRKKYDQEFGQRDATIQIHALLKDLPAKISIPAERGYLEEALICFRHKAFRAAVVMCSNLAFDHLCEFILKDAARLAGFNLQLPKSYPKADLKSVSIRDHFTELKESQVITVCKSAHIVSGNVATILSEKLKRRNIAAHPSGVTTSEPTAEEFIKDLIENVVLKLL